MSFATLRWVMKLEGIFDCAVVNFIPQHRVYKLSFCSMRSWICAPTHTDFGEPSTRMSSVSSKALAPYDSSLLANQHKMGAEGKKGYSNYVPMYNETYIMPKVQMDMDWITTTD